MSDIIHKLYISVPLKEVILDSYGGGTPSTKEDAFWDGDIPWTTTAIIENSSYYLTKFQRNITHKGLANSSSKIVPKGSILFGSRVGVGKVVITSFDIAINQDIAAFIPNEKIVPEFFLYALKSPSVKSQIKDKKRGTTIKGIPRNDLLEITIPLPSLEDQQAIARTLRTVQEAQERTEAVINATQDLKAAMMRHLFTYGSVPITEKDQVRLKKTDIGLIPENWKISTINDLCTLIVDCPHSTPFFTESGYLVIRTSHVKDGQLILRTLSHTDYKGYISRISRAEPIEGDILLTREAPIGEACIVPSNVKLCLGQQMVLLRPEEAKIHNKFLLYSLYSEFVNGDMKGKGSGVTAPHLNVKDVKKQHIPLPSISKQHDITLIITQIDEKIGIEQNTKRSLQNLFDGLLMSFMKKM